MRNNIVQMEENMDRILKNVKVGILLTAIMCIGLGVVLILYPQISTIVICYAFGGILVICALFHVVLYFKYKQENTFVNFNLIVAVITGVIGLWIVLKPEMVVMIIPIIFGIVLVIHGIIDFKQAFELKEKYFIHWWFALILAFLNVGFAVILFWNPFSTITTLVVMIGVSFVYDGISDIWIISRISKAESDINKSLETINKTLN